MPTPISIHIAAKWLCRPHHRPKILVKGSKWGPIGSISILGCMVPNTCGQGQGRIKGVKGAKGSEGEQRKQRGVKAAKGSEGSKGE